MRYIQETVVDRSGLSGVVTVEEKDETGGKRAFTAGVMRNIRTLHAQDKHRPPSNKRAASTFLPRSNPSGG